MKYFIKGSTFALLLVLQLNPTRSVAQSPLAGIEEVVAAAMDEGKIPGLALLVVKNDTVLMSQGFGVKSIDSDELVTPRTTFQVASFTKAVTSTAIAILVDQGLVNWDDPIKKHLPEFSISDPWVETHFTIRDALAMNSGMTSADTIALFSSRSRPEILSDMKLFDVSNFRAKYGSAPNLMYFLAGEVVRSVSGSYDDFVENRIYKKLGMEETTLRFDKGSSNPLLAAPHDLKDGEIVQIQAYNAENVAAAAGTFTNIADWSNWVRLHLSKGVFEGERLVSEKALRETYKPHNVLTPAYQGFFNPDANLLAAALGWVVGDYQNHKIVEFGGALPGYGSFIALVPAQNLGVVILTNLELFKCLPTLIKLKFEVLDRFVKE